MLNKPASVESDLVTALSNTNPIYQFIRLFIRKIVDSERAHYIPCLKMSSRFDLDILNFNSRITELDSSNLERFIKEYELLGTFKKLNLYQVYLDFCTLYRFQPYSFNRFNALFQDNFNFIYNEMPV